MMATFGKDPVPEQLDTKARGAATVIAPETRFVGEVTGRRAVRVEGNLKGTVKLEAPLDLAATASVKGDIQAPALRVVEGAKLEGKVQMHQEPKPRVAGEPVSQLKP
jgi:cytoskeletal protein CcmA (bactofilin family)